jgi:hypothetical protein
MILLHGVRFRRLHHEPDSDTIEQYDAEQLSAEQSQAAS